MRAPGPIAVSIIAAFAAPAAAGVHHEGYTTLRIAYEHPHQRMSALTAGPSSRIVHLDGCWDGGCALEPYEDETGNLVEDSREGYSSIIEEPVTIPAFPHGRDRFEEVAACVRGIFGPFGVQITTEDPGDVPHWRHVMGGLPEDASFAENILGVAPYDFDTCRPIPNAISYGFAELVGDDVLELCELAAHEIGHPLGLDHAYLCSDPMTYLPSCGPKAFQDVDAECGERSGRPCQCSSTQNSHDLLLGEFGERQGPGVTLEVVSPAPGAEVSAGYGIELEVGSDVLDRVDVALNSQYREVLEGTELRFSPPADVSGGIHRYEIVATDHYGTTAEVSFEVVQGDPCANGGDCAGGEACVDGRCVPGPSADGGLGDACADHADCLSGRCSIDPDKEIDDTPSGACVEPCAGDGSAGGCPGGFSCRAAPDDEPAAGPVCLADGGGFCAVAPGGRPGDRAPLGLAGALFAWMALRRARRRAGPRARLSDPR